VRIRVPTRLSTNGQGDTSESLGYQVLGRMTSFEWLTPATCGAHKFRSTGIWRATLQRAVCQVLLAACVWDGRVAGVTTPSAKADGFCRWQKPLVQQRLLRLRTGHPLTLTPEGPVRADCIRPCRPEGAALMLVFLPSRREVLNAIPTAEHLRGDKRHRFYPVAFPLEPTEPMSHVKVLCPV
jgi:hypothetical protein